MAVKRRCADCPPWTQTVCRHAFAAFWNAKSGNVSPDGEAGAAKRSLEGCEGCDHPLDDVAEAWRKAGWTPDKGVTKTIALPLPAAPRRPATVSMTQLKMPVRPKVSARIAKQAEMFFRGLK